MRPYTADDLPAALQFVGRCFRDNQLRHHHPGDIVHWMSNGYRGTDLDQYFWLCEEQGELTAFAELSKGEWASYTLITHPQRREGGRELALIAECQTLMRQRMKENPNKCVLSTNVAASDQERVTWLKKLGYHVKLSNRVVALRSLETPLPVPVLPKGFGIRSAAGENEAGLVAAVHNGSFGSSWSPEAYLKVMRTPAFKVGRELVVVAPDGRFAAFLIYWLDPVSKSGLFEPVGCHEDFQRRGLTSALMHEAMKRMVNAGMEKAVVGYNSDSVAAKKLYASVGFGEHFKTLDCELKVAKLA